MHKVQAAPAEGDTAIRWIGNGKTIYNNKGNAVMQYEPYFSTTPIFDSTEYMAAIGVTARLHYDPLNRVIRTDLPDGSYTQTEWDSWMQTIYDNNDTVLTSNWYTAAMASGVPERVTTATNAAVCDSTPTIVHLDTLARAFYNRLQNRVMVGGVPGPITPYDSHVVLDIQGDAIQEYNANGQMPLSYAYNMLKGLVKSISIDSGTFISVHDAQGNSLYSWDADNRQFHFAYDALRRRLTRDVTPSGGANKVLEVNVYGEGAVMYDTSHNLRGAIYKIYDGAGVETIPDYDFKGSPISFIRQFVTDPTQSPDWTTISGVSMEPTLYNEAQAYDALGRTVSITTPDNAVTTYTYDLTGSLFSVAVSGVHSLTTDIVNEVYYDALGRRLKIKYENGATTTYAYDPDTFRVIEITTTRSSDSAVLQDLKYWYDPIGNIAIQEDAAQQSVYFNGTVAEPVNNYTYDALYRLIVASGRELIGLNAAPNYNDSARTGQVLPTDTSAMQPYIQYYSYDGVGNMLQMKHTAGVGVYVNYWTRNYTISATNNQLTQTSIGSNNPSPESYTYDLRGNMVIGMNHLTSMAYNEDNQLQVVVDVSGTITTYYQYDCSGQRIRKVTINSGANLTQTRKYIGDWEVYDNVDSGTGSIILERETLHIIDDDNRIALIDTPTINTTGSGEEQLLRYQFSNNMSTAALELDDAAAVISYEEYYPFGSTSFQGGRSIAEVSLKRYRFAGKERDDESGLYYMGARYYAPWLARWTQVDALESETSPQSPYDYADNNPIVLEDITGLKPRKRKPGVNGEDKLEFDKNGNVYKKWHFFSKKAAASIAHEKAMSRAHAAEARHISQKKKKSTNTQQGPQQQRPQQQSQQQSPAKNESGNNLDAGSAGGGQGGQFSPDPPPPTNWENIKNWLSKAWENIGKAIKSYLPHPVKDERTIQGYYLYNSNPEAGTDWQSTLNPHAAPGSKSVDMNDIINSFKITGFAGLSDHGWIVEPWEREGTGLINIGHQMVHGAELTNGVIRVKESFDIIKENLEQYSESNESKGYNEGKTDTFNFENDEFMKRSDKGDEFFPIPNGWDMTKYDTVPIRDFNYHDTTAKGNLLREMQH